MVDYVDFTQGSYIQRAYYNNICITCMQIWSVVDLLLTGYGCEQSWGHYLGSLLSGNVILQLYIKLL